MYTILDKLKDIKKSQDALKVSINNKGGNITDDTPFKEYATQVDNLPAPSYWDGTYEESNGESGYTLTLNCNSSVVNSSYYTYSLDSGSTWNRFTSTTMTLENVQSIKFGGKAFANGYYQIRVGTSSGGSDIGSSSSQTYPIDYTLSNNTTLYVSGGFVGGGGND